MAFMQNAAPWIKHTGAIATLALLAACQSGPLPPSAMIPSGAAPGPAPAPPSSAASDAATLTMAVDLHTLPDLAAIIPRLAESRVVFVGELHTDYAAHLNQLAIIRGVHERRPDLAIGMEYFQQPFQRYLDDYVAGRITETELLAKTEYFTRWGYDFRLYEPILAYARQQHIPLVALNVPSEIVRKVGRSGFSGLSAQERAQVPQDMDRSSAAYRDYLQSVFREHPGATGMPFDHFFDAQLLWDEGMAACAARYLHEHPGRAMVILAGSGHVQYGFGLPDRLSRRLPVSRTVVVDGLSAAFATDLADIVLLHKEMALPPAGTLGVTLEPAEDGLRIASFAENSAARATGLRPGDRILSLNGQTMKDLADVKLVMWDKRPGDRVVVRVRRHSWLLSAREMSFEVTLR